MTLKQLLYFVRTVESGNMTRAARALHVAQPALSQQIANLEADMGVPLLVRGPRGINPTAEGTILYSQAQTVLRQVAAIRSVLARDEGPVAGVVSVAMASSTARMLALPLIRAVGEQHPGIELEIVDLPSADLTLMVQQGRVDISLSPDQEKVLGLSVAPLVTEELLILAHPAVPLPANDLAVTDLVDVPLILPRSPNKLRMRIEHAFMTAQLSYRLLAQASTSAILVPAVVEGLAATILPYSAASREIRAQRVRACRLAPPLSRTISVCTNPFVATRRAVTTVVDMIGTLTRTLVTNGHWQYCRLAGADATATPEAQAPR